MTYPDISGLIPAASASHLASIAAARALAAERHADFRAQLVALNVNQLRRLAKAVRANTRGCTVRAHFEDAIEQRWTAEVWDIAGYRYGGHRPAPAFYPAILVPGVYADMTPLASLIGA